MYELIYSKYVSAIVLYVKRHSYVDAPDFSKSFYFHFDYIIYSKFEIYLVNEIK